MTQAKHGDMVKIHYTGRLEDGTVFDTSIDREPLQIKLGENQVIQGFEKAIIGMNLDESKTFTIPSDEAYGPYREEMLLDMPKNEFPPNIQPEIGQQLELRQENDQAIIVTVSKVSESDVTLDANHPLAGEDLTFDIQLIEII
ncbi:MAG: peptidylprolyl isomerase [Thermodesulfobacteriota bacterium]|nr:peptidylprolyl isomerase [Thermodesulfobacteriota bacterium]